MRSERALLVASLLVGGCAYDWDGLRPLPNTGADVPVTADLVDAAAAEASAPQDALDAPALPDVLDAGVAPDVPAMPDVPAVVDVPTAMDVVDVPAAMDVVDVPPARDVVDVPTVTDTGPSCVGLSCPCVPGNPTGYCRVGEQCVSGACAAATAAGALVFTEIMNDTGASVGEPEGEWIEVYNPAGYAVDLRGMRVRDANTMSAITAAGPPLLVLPRAYAVIGRAMNLGISGGMNLALATYDTVSLNNSGSETVTLSTETGAQIDSVTYGAGWPVTSGRSKSLRPMILDATMNDMGANWCAGGPSYAPANYGTPGAPNVCQ